LTSSATAPNYIALEWGLLYTIQKGLLEREKPLHSCAKNVDNIGVICLKMTMSTMTMHDFIRDIGPKPEIGPDWAFVYYKATLSAAVQAFGLKSLLEVGGGRAPLFTAAEVDTLGVRYTVNDIDETELARAPEHVDKQCFDIGGIIPSAKYDLIFSSCVFEHVRDVKRAYENVFALLNPGGIALNLHPVLYSMPFIINKLMPEVLTEKIVGSLIGKSHHRKFPAHYSWCYATSNVTDMLADIGFAETEIIPFYGHNYYQRIPLLRDLHRSLSRKLAQMDARWTASYVYTMGRRGT
jgi:SAM-dependent methyltransferase